MRWATPAGLALAATLLLPAALDAHSGRPPEPHDVWSMWRPSSLLLVALALVAAAYFRGVRTVWARAGAGSGMSRGQATAFAAAICTLLLALASPIDLVSSALFSVHMLQHLLLVLIAGPLLAYARPEIALLWSLPTNARRGIARWGVRNRWLHRVWRAIASPGPAWALHAVAVWAWHAPRLYDGAVQNEGLHFLEHSVFLATAVLFARPLVTGARLGSRALSSGASVIYLFGAAMQSGILGALLTLSSTVWYSAHLATTGPWGLTPHEDQQVAGVLMWGPAGGAYLLAILWAMRNWLAASHAGPARPLAGASPPVR